MIVRFLLNISVMFFALLGWNSKSIASGSDRVCNGYEQVVKVQRSVNSTALCSGEYQQKLTASVRSLDISATQALEQYEAKQERINPKAEKWELQALSVGIGASVSGGVGIVSGFFDTHIRMIYSKEDSPELDD